MARAVWEEGFAVFPVDQSLVEPARTGFKQFLKRRDEKGNHADWLLCRPGESTDDPDLGLIQRGGGEYDVKSFFHHDISLIERLQLEGLLTNQMNIECLTDDEKFLAANEHLLNALGYFGHSLAAGLDEMYQLGCADRYMECLKRVQPYSTTILRSLFYPDGPEQTGAKAHVDRSFLTIHLGDEGGKLQALDAQGSWMDISPPEGYAIAFFGVKALWVTQGQKSPLRHRSVTIPGQDRFAFVNFGHVALRNYYVRDAGTAALDFERSFRSRVESGAYHWR